MFMKRFLGCFLRSCRSRLRMRLRLPICFLKYSSCCFGRIHICMLFMFFPYILYELTQDETRLCCQYVFLHDFLGVCRSCLDVWYVIYMLFIHFLPCFLWSCMSWLRMRQGYVANIVRWVSHCQSPCLQNIFLGIQIKKCHIWNNYPPTYRVFF